MEIAEPLLIWFEQNARKLPWRETRDPYAIWISEIMLQQTRVSAALPYYARWMQALPDVQALNGVPDERLKKLWEGLGYYSRARNLKRAAQRVVDVYGGALPASYEALLTLPGVGAYTAGAVASIAFDLPVPAVDGNVLRVWARLTNDASDILLPGTRRAVTEAVAAALPKNRPGAFNAALMELGATVCVPGGAPHCAECPLACSCRARAAGTALSLPVRGKKKPRRVEEKTVFVLLDAAGRPAVYQRPAAGLLAGLWQLPDLPGFLDANAAAAQMTRWNVRAIGEMSVCARRHIFTHIEWRMRVYAAAAEFDPMPEGWARLESGMALPSAYRVCLPEEKPGGGTAL